MGVARGKQARLVTDHACDKPQKSQTYYYILFEFREELLAVARLPWKGCVQGDTGLDGECDEIFTGAVAAVVMSPNYLLCNSQACKVWACEYLSSLSESLSSSITFCWFILVYGSRLPVLRRCWSCDLQVSSCTIIC